mmetsp:Transcript_41019/g.30170  ORF Transcript_41019/g.30170 Transcript_41019/m.30170 type:complete len:95 (+) Transcript_41019:837-1121(+)
MLLDLKTIKFKVYPKKHKNGEVFELSPEDSFMMSNMQAESTGHCVFNSYQLNVTINFESMQCCGQPLHAAFPITVLPVMYQEQVIMAQPVDFNP